MLDKLEIIYEDRDILVCYKPAGIATQTRRLGQPDMESLIRNYLAEKHEKPYVGIVHRLDQPVEGIMVFGKNKKAAAGLSEQVQSHEIGKYYKAVCRHISRDIIPDKGTLIDYMTYDKKVNVGYVLDPEETEEFLKNKGNLSKKLQDSLKTCSGMSTIDGKDIKKAILDYQVINKNQDRIIFDIHLHTGRHHQIRLQMANMNCPIIGDKKYGSRETDDSSRTQLALCSYRLAFMHPITKKPMEFTIEPQFLTMTGL